LLRQSHQQLGTAHSDGFLNRLDIPPVCQVAERPARLQAQFSDEHRGNAWACWPNQLLDACQKRRHATVSEAPLLVGSGSRHHVGESSSAVRSHAQPRPE
jgi:hypothetical protein